MKRCLKLAEKGKGNVSPNPLVGCVIIKGGKIISEGFHKKYGSAHAERNAINAAKRKGINLQGAELYVNLEPCVHFGKTPPCCDLIIKHKIKRVTIGIKDPNKLVNGKGIKKLRQAGIKVTCGVLKDECREMNKFFFKYMQTGLPFVLIKSAQTIDCKIADKNFNSKWISSLQSRKTVHLLRSEYDAVLVGANTVRKDNPSLNVRFGIKSRNPYRIVIDKKLKLSEHYKIFNYKDGKTIIITSKLASKTKKNRLTKKGNIIIECKLKKNGKIDLHDALKKLGEMKITSIMAEGGAKTHKEFLKSGLADEILVFISPKIMGSGILSFNPLNYIGKLAEVKYGFSNGDIVINLKNKF